MDGFRVAAAKRNTATKRLRYNGRNRKPEELKVYLGRKVARTKRGKSVTKAFKALAIPNWYRYSLRKYGEPFVYHGCLTKRYSRKSLFILFSISHMTLSRWVRDGLMPEPMLRVARPGGGESIYWLYHQVQPVYVWYHHMRSRGIKVIKPTFYPEEMKLLRRQLRKLEALFLQRAGHTIVSDYESFAGKYGVLWINEEESQSPLDE